jgi:hypothetical protein
VGVGRISFALCVGGALSSSVLAAQSVPNSVSELSAQLIHTIEQRLEQVRDSERIAVIRNKPITGGATTTYQWLGNEQRVSFTYCTGVPEAARVVFTTRDSMVFFTDTTGSGSAYHRSAGGVVHDADVPQYSFAFKERAYLRENPCAPVPSNADPASSSSGGAAPR